MIHRSGTAFRKASARDLGVLALGVVLVVTGVGLSMCGSLGENPGSAPVVGVGSPTSSATPEGPPWPSGGEHS
jgi:hypothetical protein